MKPKSSIYKRTLSILLAVVLLFSACVCSFTGSVSAAGAVSDLSASTAADWQAAYPQNLSDAGALNSRYGGNAIKHAACAYQRITAQVALQPSTTYRLRFSVMSNAMNLVEFFEVESGVTPEYKNSSAQDASTTKNIVRQTNLFSGKDGATWVDIDWSFTTSEATGRDYYINLRSGTCNGEGQTNTAYYSDFSLVKVTENSSNLLNNLTTADWKVKATSYNKVEALNNSRYGGSAFLNTTASYQNIYTKLALEANTTYRLRFSAKVNAINRVEYFAVAAGTAPDFNNSTMSGQASLLAGEYKNFDNVVTNNGESSWKDIDVTFTTGSATEADRYLNIRFGACTGDGLTNSGILSDFSLMKVTENSKNLLEKATVTDWKAYKWNDPAVSKDAKLENSNNARYGGNAIYNANIAYSNLYTKVALQPDTAYTFKFSVKAAALYLVDYMALNSGSTVQWTNGGNNFDLTNANVVESKRFSNDKNQLATASENEWADITVEFTTGNAANVDYYLNIHFGAGGTGNAAYLSDFSLVKKEADNNLMSATKAANWTADNGNKITNADTSFSHKGGNVIKHEPCSYHRMTTKLDLKPNATYSLNFSVKSKEVNLIEFFETDTGVAPVFVNNSANGTSATKAITRKQNIVAANNGTEWVEVTWSFTTSNAIGRDYYLNIRNGNCGDPSTEGTAYYSDFNLVQTGSVLEATAEGNGAAKVTEDQAAGTVTFTATPYQADRFEGWYTAAGQKISTEAVYTVNAAEYQALTAKFTGTNLLKTVPLSNWSDASNKISVASANQSRYGGLVFKHDTCAYQRAVLKLDLQPNTVYKLTLSAKSHAMNLIEFFEVQSGVTPEYKNSSASGAATTKNIARKTNLYDGKDGATWVDVEYTFTTSSASNRDYYVNLRSGACNGEGKTNTAYYSDLSLVVTDVILTAKSEGNGGAKVTEDEAAGTVTFIATPYHESTFEGWYNTAGQKLSEQATYTVATADYAMLTAKFTGTNMLKDLTVDDWDGYVWNSKEKGNISETVDSHYGGSAVLNKAVAWQKLYTKIPVQANSTYRLSFSVKANELFETDIYAMQPGQTDAWGGSSTINPTLTEYFERIKVPEAQVSENEFTRVEIAFSTPDLLNVDWYFCIHFGNCNAAGLANTAVVSDLSLTVVPPGYFEDTSLSYCETYYNLLPKANAVSANVTGNTVIEIPLKKGNKHTFGVNVSGNGTATLAFDRSGDNVIQELSTNGTRSQFTLLAQPTDGFAYLILKPNGSMSYKDLYCFVTSAVSIGSNMGYEEDPNTAVTPTYLSAEEVEYLTLHDENAPSDNTDSTDNTANNTESTGSPATGDSTNPAPAVAILLSAAALMFVLQAKKPAKRRSSKEVR